MMMPSNSDDNAYAAIARWYDVEHDLLTEDIACYLQLFAAMLPQHATVLEVGSGTGRIAAALALAGYAVVGVEPSAAMRERCAKRLAALPQQVARRVHIHAGSATALPLAGEQRFNAALFSLNTFAHLTTQAERHAALVALRPHLRPGGLLLLDLDLAGPRRLAEQPQMLWWQGTWPVPDSSLTMTHFVAASASPSPGCIALTHFYDACEQDGTVRRTLASMTLALLTRGEVELALLHAGYELVTIASGYDLSEDDDGAAHALFLARVAGARVAPDDDASLR